MIERAGSELCLKDQADLLSVSRSSLYYAPRPPSAKEVMAKHKIDELYTNRPFYGARRMAVELRKSGVNISRNTARSYMRDMGLEAIYPKPNLSAPNPENRIYPYLLRGLEIARPDHVWGIDITYIRLERGWMYLVAILDWYSRYIVSWELDQTLEIGFVLSCVDSALAKASPEILNSDQGSHFTSQQYTTRLINKDIAVSMDGRGRAFDNIFTERLWRTVKYEEVYIKNYESPRDTRQNLTSYLQFYNEERPHMALGYRTPAEVYRQDRS
jgi:putative transposase